MMPIVEAGASWYGARLFRGLYPSELLLLDVIEGIKTCNPQSRKKFDWLNMLKWI